MTAEELFEEGRKHRSRALDNTQYTHIHSVDIENYVFKNYFLPAANEGYAPAIIEVAKYYLEKKEYSEVHSWAKRYKELTGCSRREFLKIFGLSYYLGILK